jgi:hypothetical protein
LDIADLRTVLGCAAAQYGKPQKQLTDPMKCYGPSYYRKATAR